MNEKNYNEQPEFRPFPEKREKRYDERQQLIRYRAFTHGFIILAALIFLNVFLAEPTGIVWFEVWSGSAVMVVIAFCAAMAEIVWLGAWVPPGQKHSLAWAIFDFVFFAAITVGHYVIAFRKADQFGIELIKDGCLDAGLMSAVTFTAFTVVPLTFLVRTALDRFAKPEEDDE